MKTASSPVQAAAPSKRRRAQAGFSLVEVALAMLVISVGVLAAVSLFPTSMDSNKKSIDDTQIALYADYVLGTLQSYVASTNIVNLYGWKWDTFVNNPGAIAVSAAAVDMWKDPTNLMIKADGNLTKLAFFSLKSNVEEMNLEARLTIGPSPDYNSYSIRRATLEVWPYSAQNTNGYHQFQVELYRGDLP